MARKRDRGPSSIVLALDAYRQRLKGRALESSARACVSGTVGEAERVVRAARGGLRFDTREACEDLWRDLERLVLAAAAASDSVLELWLSRQADGEGLAEGT